MIFPFKPDFYKSRQVRHNLGDIKTSGIDTEMISSLIPPRVPGNKVIACRPGFIYLPDPAFKFALRQCFARRCPIPAAFLFAAISAYTKMLYGPIS